MANLFPLTAVTDPKFVLFKHVLCFARIMLTLCPNVCRQTAQIGGQLLPPSRTPMTSSSGQNHSAYGLQKTAATGKNSSVKRWLPTIKLDLSKRSRRLCTNITHIIMFVQSYEAIQLLRNGGCIRISRY